MASTLKGRLNNVILLLENNANPNIKNNDGYTALDILKIYEDNEYDQDDCETKIILEKIRAYLVLYGGK